MMHEEVNTYVLEVVNDTPEGLKGFNGVNGKYAFLRIGEIPYAVENLYNSFTTKANEAFVFEGDEERKLLEGMVERISDYLDDKTFARVTKIGLATKR